jgi:tetratricopeptide (TPR) repeat protein
MFSWAESDNTTTVKMSTLDAVKLAGKMVYAGDYERAQSILVKMPQTNNLPVEIERWYLLAQIEQKKGNIDEAIRIYRKILDDQPDLAKIRYELAICYMMKHQWYRADYHLRLAMAGKDIPDEMKQRMMYLRYVIRQNKRWNAWFNFGAAPDTNVNQVSNEDNCIKVYDYYSGEEYLWCEQDQAKPEKAVGYNFLLGGNYEFVLSEHWHWKNEGNIYTNIYNKHRFDDLFVSVSTGPRYIWDNGDVWLAGVMNRRWYGWDGYSWGVGGKIDTHYDWSRKFSTGLTLQVLNNDYDEYGEYMNGQTFGVLAQTYYSFDASKYFVVFSGMDRDTAKNDIYANWRYTFGIGIGGELPYGFSVYLEPSFVWTNYDSARWAVKDYQYVKIRESDFMQRYSFSVSNNKIDVFGFVPLLTVSYTDKDSNIHSREYEKWTMEFTLRQKF